MREYKQVTWRSLKPGDKVKGWREGNRVSMANAVVKEANPAYVTILKFGEYEEKLNSETTLFDVEMTDKEVREKYADAAAEIVKSIQTKLHEAEIGYHEIWNSWVNPNPYEMAAYCQKYDFKIIGHVSLSVPKTAMFSGDKLDIGICSEYSDGERFWCHARSSYIEDMLEYYQMCQRHMKGK